MSHVRPRSFANQSRLPRCRSSVEVVMPCLDEPFFVLANDSTRFTDLRRFQPVVPGHRYRREPPLRTAASTLDVNVRRLAPFVGVEEEPEPINNKYSRHGMSLSRTRQGRTLIAVNRTMDCHSVGDAARTTMPSTRAVPRLLPNLSSIFAGTRSPPKNRALSVPLYDLLGLGQIIRYAFSHNCGE